jgi:hypothetical protein
MKSLFRKTDGARTVPVDPQREAAIRRSLVWVAISYVPLLGGAAWAIFAIGHWAGSRGGLLAASGGLVGLAASSALLFPFLRVTSPNRRFIGMSVAAYTVVSTMVGIAIAVVLAIIALAVPLT